MPKLPPVQLERLGQPEMVYRVPSTSREGVYHYVFHWGSVKGISCTCEAARFGRHCKHVDLVPLCHEVHIQVGHYYKGVYTPGEHPVECGLPEHHGGKHSWER